MARVKSMTKITYSFYYLYHHVVKILSLGLGRGGGGGVEEGRKQVCFRKDSLQLLKP